MKKFRFRLETVHRVRELQDELARGDLQVANHELAKASHVVRQREEVAQSTARPLGPTTVDAFACAQFVIEQAAAAVRWAERDRDAAIAVAEQRRQLWLEANMKLRAIDRLRETARDQYRDEVRHAEDVTNDEMATMRHTAKLKHEVQR